MIRPNIEAYALDYKVRQANKLLGRGYKVRVMIIYRGRESPHQQIGLALLQKVTDRLSEVARVEVEPEVEGRTLGMVLAPRGTIPGAEAPVGAKPKSGPPTLSAAAEAEIPKEK